MQAQGIAQPPAATPQRGTPNDTDPTLRNALRKAAMEQGSNREVIEDFFIQRGKPAHAAAFRDWLAGQPTVIVAAGIMAGNKYVRPMHSLMLWTARRADDEHSGVFFAAVGERVDGQDPLWCEVRHDAFAGGKAYLPNTAPTSAIAQHYTDPANRLTLFEAT